MILYLTPKVREAALDLRALRNKIDKSGVRAYQWVPAEATARRQLVSLSSHKEDAEDPVAIRPHAELSFLGEPNRAEIDASPSEVVNDAASTGPLLDEHFFKIQNPK
jgi:hypothetical protein